ncbi:MAG: outer membrane protein assembly factor BamA [Chlamydiia bacterium]|nr:outer membrane protein assembly factor BamA [Chlamydiia bacterium]
MTKMMLRLFLLSLCLVGQLAAAASHENVVIGDVYLQMMDGTELTKSDTQAIMGRIKSQKGQFFSHTVFDADLKLLSQEFDRVEPSVVQADGKLIVTLKIWPKPLIRSIQWYGNLRVPRSTLRAELGIAPGAAFDRNVFNTAFQKIRSYYTSSGYFEASVDYTVDYDCETREVDIAITVDEGRCGKIKNICFTNFSRGERWELQRMMATKRYDLIRSLLWGEGNYNQEMVERDHFMILNYLQNQGYADATVSVDVQEAQFPNRINLCIAADRGPCYQFGDVTIKGNCLYTEEQIRQVMTICKGENYSPEAIRDTIESIQMLYGCRGYIDAVVNYELRLDPDCPIYHLDIAVEEGKQYCVGLIRVFGNCTTETRVILHETLLYPGEVFNSVRMKRTEERLMNMGYFKHVNVYAVRNEGCSSLGENYRDVHIEVEEGSTGKVSAFFGYSTNEQVFGGLSIGEENFSIKGLTRLSCDGLGALRGGGEYAHVNLMLGAKSRSYNFSWTKPHFNDTPWTVGFDVAKTNNRYYSSGTYETNTFGTTLRAYYQYNAFVRFGWHYRFQNSWTDVLKKKKTEELNELADAKGLISATGITLTYDSTNSPYRPTCGFKSVFEAEVAGLGGDHDFFSLGYNNGYYIPYMRDGVLKFRADFKFLLPYNHTDLDSLPVDERLFLGGDDTVRGYRAYRLGPQLSNKDSKGGLSLQLFSVEYAHLLSSRMEAFAFADAGNLSGKEFNFENYKVSWGFGCRLKVLDMFPPVTLGIGFPINPDNRSQVKKFFFNFGAKF